MEQEHLISQSLQIRLIKMNTMGCCYKSICCKTPVTADPVQLIWPLSCFSFTGIFELSNGSKWIRSNVSYYGAMRAGQSHQTLYFDGCGHTDSHNHTYMLPHHPFLPLLPHTSPDSKAHKHTPRAGGQRGRKSIFEELGYLASWSRFYCRQTIVFPTMQLSACSSWVLL